jgi:hypothetical protein
MKVEFSRQVFDKYSAVKFHENLPDCSGVVTCTRAGGRTVGKTRMTKLILAFCGFSDARNIGMTLKIVACFALGLFRNFV